MQSTDNIYKQLENLKKEAAEMRRNLEIKEEAIQMTEKILGNSGAKQESSIQSNNTFSIDFDELDISEKTDKTLADSIKEVIQSFGSNEFKVQHVEAALKKIGRLPNSKSPRATIAMALTKLEKNGEVERTFKGTGSTPHRFRARNKAQVEFSL